MNLFFLEEFDLTSEVVGVADPIADKGEVPMAVIKERRGSLIDINKMRSKIVEKLGDDFAIENMTVLDDFGVKDFPRTATGKVK